MLLAVLKCLLGPLSGGELTRRQQDSGFSKVEGPNGLDSLQYRLAHHCGYVIAVVLKASSLNVTRKVAESCFC